MGFNEWRHSLACVLVYLCNHFLYPKSESVWTVETLYGPQITSNLAYIHSIWEPSVDTDTVSYAIAQKAIIQVSDIWCPITDTIWQLVWPQMLPTIKPFYIRALYWAQSCPDCLAQMPLLDHCFMWGLKTLRNVLYIFICGPSKNLNQSLVCRQYCYDLG